MSHRNSEGKNSSEVDDYMKAYDFGIRRGGGARTADPVRRQAMSDAKDLVWAALAKKGIKRKDTPAEEVTKLAEAALNKYPHILEAARVAVEARKAAAESIDIGL